MTQSIFCALAARRDFSKPYQPSMQVAGAWLVCHNADRGAHHRLQAGTGGTGGTGGVSYLAKALELTFFLELWQIRTSM